MKQYLSAIISAVSVAVAAVCLFRVIDLETRIIHLENEVSSGFSRVESTVNGISYNIRTTLEEQAKLIADSGWSYTGFDVEKKSAAVTCSVTPKEYQPEKTVATVFCGEQEIPLKLENGTYTAAFEIPLFENSVVSRVQFVEDDTVRTESLDWNFYPRYDLLPSVVANFHGSYSMPHQNGVSKLNFNGAVEVDINVSKESSVDVVSLKLLRYLDGTLTDTIDMLTENTIVEKSEYMHFYSFPLEQVFEVPAGSAQKLYVDVQDANGLHYVTLINHISVDEKGAHNSEDIYRYPDSNIYDDKGMLIYAVDESLYQ